MTDPSQYFKGRTVQEQMNEVIGYVDVRSAEVATTAIASDVAQVHQDMLDANADATAAAVSAAAAAGTLANAVKKTGEASQSIAGDIAVAGTLSGGVVTGAQVTVPVPVNNTDAANKKYVDDADALMVPIADINQYAVGLTGNQDDITGNKRFVNNSATTSSSAAPKGILEKTNIDMSVSIPGNRYLYTNSVVDQNGAIVASIRVAAISSTQEIVFALATTKADGTTITLRELARYNRTTDTWS